MGILGNLLVIFVVLRVKQIRTITNYFVTHQAIIDFVSSTLILYHYVVPIRQVPDGVAGDIVCRLWAARYPMWTSLLASTYNLVALTLERYVAIVYPFRYVNLFTKFRIVPIFVITWVFCFLFKAVNLPRTKADNGQCVFTNGVYTPTEYRVIAVVNFIVEYLFPLSFMVFAYTHIVVVLNSKILRVGPGMPSTDLPKAQQDSMHRAMKNTIKTLLVVCIAFAVMWSPNQLYYFAFNINPNIRPNRLTHHVSIIIAFFNSCINPIIYAIKYKQFRDGMKVAFNFAKFTSTNAITSIT
ncbi:neuromedin-K receptor-like [Ptychodera flava]|uniref:neuromedin-K receptor-like n=1 Tax=Ptychodera flava TaxID=63121 RepID=UPI00396A6CA6